MSDATRRVTRSFDDVWVVDPISARAGRATVSLRNGVIEKLEFGLVYGTDIEKVRKILKKIGEAMMQDPEIAAVLLEPLKSQGVSRLTDSSMVLRATASPWLAFSVS